MEDGCECDSLMNNSIRRICTTNANRLLNGMKKLLSQLFDGRKKNYNSFGALWKDCRSILNGMTQWIPIKCIVWTMNEPKAILEWFYFISGIVWCTSIGSGIPCWRHNRNYPFDENVSRTTTPVPQQKKKRSAILAKKSPCCSTILLLSLQTDDRSREMKTKDTETTADTQSERMFIV